MKPNKGKKVEPNTTEGNTGFFPFRFPTPPNPNPNTQKPPKKIPVLFILIMNNLIIVLLYWEHHLY